VAYLGQPWIQGMLKALGSQDVAIGAAHAEGIVDDLAANMLAGESSGVVLQANSKRIRLETGTLAGLAIGAVLVTGGQQFTVYWKNPIEDGGLTEIFCARKP
jgi:hypothetical protein